ncbi:SE1832 family protein [Halobacillus sp. Marseille-Q1614]|uniref:SE1832 family protein n=1 Tax=Halobacillus sp. Marseille-Q1614 TaxID=2709134 RepID=UPI00156D7A64|nr:SE1832 family protein [Halobacillus sp. Marseille-Q1614]
MTKQEIRDEIAFLKSDYIRIQGDLEKLDAAGGNVENAEKQLAQMEDQLKDLKQQLAKAPE